ncbi:MAG: flagellar hook-associated protein FlgK, partial [Caulobacteraceae bacterium]|nr:flagellar hook-associated protein FlgK [Caulobacteraceae bacterium]
VRIRGVERVTDQYLQKADLTAVADLGRWEILSQYLDRAQGLFGDPSGEGFFFNKLDEAFNTFAAAADDPSSSLLRSQAVSQMQDFLNDATRIDKQIEGLQRDVDSRISAGIDRANVLLRQIDGLNADKSRAKLSSGDAAGAENVQSQLIDELSQLIDVKVAERPEGGVTLRTAEGFMLAGEGAATLKFESSASTGGYISVTTAAGAIAQATDFAGGELRGLLDLRDRELPALSDQLGEFVSRAAEQLNAAHNAATAVPAPGTLTGRNTGLDLTTAMTGFTGRTTLAIVNQDGVIQRRVDIDFDAGTMTVDGAAGPGFTPGTFLASLNTALTGYGSANFAGGALSINATAAGNGVALAQDSANPSDKAGRGFSHFFGLNDVIRSTGISTYDSGLAPTDPHGFTPGDEITFSLADANGRPIRDITVAVPAGGTMADLVNALNSTTTGVGFHGQFTLDERGALTFAGSPPAYATLSVASDETLRGAGGPSMSQLFGLGAEREGRAQRYNVDAGVVNDPKKLAFAMLDLSVAAGESSLRPGDGDGARLLAGAGDVVGPFAKSGGLGAVSMTLQRYASEFGGAIGRNAAAAENRANGAAAVRTEAQQRRQSVESVNLDEELVRLMTYQQAYNASSRLINAARELYDTLLEMV